MELHARQNRRSSVQLFAQPGEERVGVLESRRAGETDAQLAEGHRKVAGVEVWVARAPCPIDMGLWNPAAMIQQELLDCRLPAPALRRGLGGMTSVGDVQVHPLWSRALSNGCFSCSNANQEQADYYQAARPDDPGDCAHTTPWFPQHVGPSGREHSMHSDSCRGEIVETSTRQSRACQTAREKEASLALRRFEHLCCTVVQSMVGGGMPHLRHFLITLDWVE